MNRLIQVATDIISFSETPFKINNSLASHPLFEPERIKQLLRTLPKRSIEIRKVQLSNRHDGMYLRGERLIDVDPVRTFEELPEKPAWMLLHDTWTHDPDYAELLRDYLAGLSQHFQEMQPAVSDTGCWMFLSSGRSVVHFHSDPDQSFLNQIRGSKTVYVYPTQLLPNESVERLVYSSNQGHVVYNSQYEPSMFPPQHLTPGESVFLPLYAPHRVVNDDGLCISWNVGFHTRKSRINRLAHMVNLELRQLGLHPTPAGHHRTLDMIKAQTHVAFRVKNKFFPYLKPQCPLP